MLLDMRHLGEKKINERLPLVRDMSISYMGVDPVTDPVPVRPVVHYMMGGIVTDLAGRSSLERLYGCGEVSCTGVHGANRLASNSLLEGLVFGHRGGPEDEREERDRQTPSSFHLTFSFSQARTRRRASSNSRS